MQRTSYGFIALSSVLVLSAVFLVLAIGIAQRSLYTTEGALSVRHASAAQLAARACAEYALIELVHSIQYEGDEVRSVGAHRCTIRPIEYNDAGGATIRTKSAVASHTQRYVVEVTNMVPDVSIGSYRTVSQF